MKTLFVAAGPISWGSSRMRCYWPARYMDAEVITIDQLRTASDLDRFGALVFQKVFSIEIAQAARETNRLVFWDVCDPAWWFSPDECRKILPHVDGVVASSQALADDFGEWADMEAHYIADRLEPSHFPLQRQHTEVDPLRFIWYGVSVNRIALGAAWANLQRLWANGYNFELTIFDNEPGAPMLFQSNFPINYARWELHKENRVLANHDVALLPPYPGAWGMVKSDNKTRTAWMCNLPVTTGTNYKAVEKVFSRKYRAGYEGRQKISKSDYPSAAAAEWEAIIENAYRSR